MNYLLIAGNDPSMSMSSSDVESYATRDEAIAHKGDRKWAIVASPSIDGYTIRLVTVAYFNVAWGDHPAEQVWVTIRSYS